MGAVSQTLAKHKVTVRWGENDLHRAQGIAGQRNKTLAERLFDHQCAEEMKLPEGQRPTEFVTQLLAVVKAFKEEVARLAGKKPSVSIKVKKMAQKPSRPAGRPVGLKEHAEAPLSHGFTGYWYWSIPFCKSSCLLSLPDSSLAVTKEASELLCCHKPVQWR